MEKLSQIHSYIFMVWVSWLSEMLHKHVSTKSKLSNHIQLIALICLFYCSKCICRQVIYS